MISLSRLLGRSVQELQTGSELLLVGYLNQYTKILLHKGISLKGVRINERLLETEYMQFVLDSEVKLDAVYANIETKCYANKFTVASMELAEMKEKTNTQWLFSREYASDINSQLLALHTRRYAYLSLFALFLVNKYLYNDLSVFIIDNTQYGVFESEFVDLMILRDYGNKLAAGMVELRYPKLRSQPECEAYVAWKRQLGYMSREYLVEEKYAKLREKFEVGDVVLLYTRQKASSGSRDLRFLSCNPAVIKSFTDKAVTLEYFASLETLLTRKRKLDDLIAEEGGQNSELLTREDYETFTKFRVTYDYISIGVDDCTWLELTLFVEPVDSDGTLQWVRSVETGEVYTEFMDTIDTIYAVFENRGVQYNKERFKERYFRGRTPACERGLFTLS